VTSHGFDLALDLCASGCDFDSCYGCGCRTPGSDTPPRLGLDSHFLVLYTDSDSVVYTGHLGLDLVAGPTLSYSRLSSYPLQVL
jgi:hypothetical protein